MDIQKAIDYWRTVPADQWNMEVYLNECGSCGCALGHVATMPGAEEEGLSTGWIDVEDAECIVFRGEVYNVADYAPLGATLFDLSYHDAKRLFGPVYEPEGSLHDNDHKAIFFNRLKQLGFIDE